MLYVFILVNFIIILEKKSNKPGQFCVHVMLLNVRMAPKSFLWECWFLLLSSDFIVQKHLKL